MDKTIIALGLMSGTSMDGIDASLIKSDGEKHIDILGNLYVKYDSELKNSLIRLTKKINNIEDLNNNIDEYKSLERIITIKHSEISLKICKKFKLNPRVVGFHGQTILHKPKDRYSIQMGNGRLLSQLLKNDVVYQFRKNDLEKGGDGAPLTPVYHNILSSKIKLEKPLVFMNIGGISNITIINKKNFSAKDVGPGNCLMDMYTKKTKKMDYDKDGAYAALGEIDSSLINNILDHDFYKSKNYHSFDIRDFDINIVKGLTFENALANLNFLTSKIIAENIKKELSGDYNIVLSGGGRKNKTLVSNLKKLLKKRIFDIDEFNFDGDFIESQAFAYLSIRSLYKKNISFPKTTKVNKPISGGELISFF